MGVLSAASKVSDRNKAIELSKAIEQDQYDTAYDLAFCAYRGKWDGPASLADAITLADEALKAASQKISYSEALSNEEMHQNMCKAVLCMDFDRAHDIANTVMENLCHDMCTGVLTNDWIAARDAALLFIA